MYAAVTERVGSMSVVERPDPGEPGSGEVLVAPEAVGICGSDYHFFSGHLSDEAGGNQFPRVQGHEVGAVVIGLGSDCRPELQVGQRVALLPIHACGRCYPCSVNRPNACDNFRLIGIHLDGGLQQRMSIGQDQVFPIQADDGAIAAMAEPVSIAVRAVRRGRIESGERVVVLGAGPIGQCVCLVARELGAEVLAVDLPPVAVDATGVPSAVRAMVDMVASAGRAVQVGMSTHEVSLRIGALTEKELDVLGVCCCTREDFAEAVGVVERNPEAVAGLISHEFALAQAPEALSFAMSNPTEVMKVVIRGE
jgi:threonine dehydrogenase-like Zn-dependent dehydrogenase